MEGRPRVGLTGADGRSWHGAAPGEGRGGGGISAPEGEFVHPEAASHNGGCGEGGGGTVVQLQTRTEQTQSSFPWSALLVDQQHSTEQSCVPTARSSLSLRCFCTWNENESIAATQHGAVGAQGAFGDGCHTTGFTFSSLSTAPCWAEGPLSLFDSPAEGFCPPLSFLPLLTAVLLFAHRHQSGVWGFVLPRSLCGSVELFVPCARGFKSRTVPCGRSGARGAAQKQSCGLKASPPVCPRLREERAFLTTEGCFGCCF